MIDADDRVVVSGGSDGGPSRDMFVARLTTDGSPDLGFGFEGKVVHRDAAGGPGDDRGRDITIDDQGRIVVVGSSGGPLGQGTFPVVWRLTDTGTLDSDFADVGFAIHDPGLPFPQNWIEAVDIDREGRIVGAGRIYYSGGPDLGVWRILEDGSPDLTFGSKGWVLYSSPVGGNVYDEGFGVLVDGAEGILVCGGSQRPQDSEATVWRYDPPGILDGDFGAAGVIMEPNPDGMNGYDTARDMVLDDQGRLLVVSTGPGAAGPTATTIRRYQ